jgi:raffinose/stachyose/melibiose transport system substrate-binding protein
MLKKIVVWAVLVGLMLGIFFGCSGCSKSNTSSTVTSAQSSKTMRFLSVWPESDPNVQLIMGLSEQYKKEINPNFTMELEVIPGDAVQRQVKIYMSSNALPELFVYYTGRPMHELIDAGVNVNIEEEFTRLGIYDSIEPGAASLLKTLEGNRNGLFELPLGMNLEGFWYNKKMFADAGIKIPVTWDDLMAACDALLKTGVTPIGVGGKQQWPITRLINAYVMRYIGPNAMQLASEGKLSFTDPRFEQAAKAIQNMAAKNYFGNGYTTLDNGGAEDMLLTGKCALIYDGSWFTAKLNDPELNHLGEGIGFFNIPLVSGGPGKASEYSTNCGSTISLAASKYDEVVADWCKYVFPRIGDKAMADFGTLKGYTVKAYPDELPYYTELVADEFKKVGASSLFFEAFMDDETTVVAKDNSQALCLGVMTSEEFCQSLEDSNQAYLAGH